MSRFICVVALITSVFLLGGGFIVARFYLEAGGVPLDIAALRYATAGLLLLPFGFYWSVQVGFGRSFLLSLTGGFVFGSCTFIGVSGAPIAHGAALIPGLGLIAGTLLAAWILGEPLGRQRLLGLSLGVLGLVVLVGPVVMGSDGSGAWWAELAYVVAGCSWAVFTVLLRLWAISPLQGSALASTFSLPVIALWWVLGEPAIGSVPEIDTLLQAAYQGFGFAIAGIALYGYAVKHLGASAAVAAMPLVPAFTALCDWWLFDGPLNVRIIMAIAMMFGCVFIIANVKKKPLVHLMPQA